MADTATTTTLEPGPSEPGVGGPPPPHGPPLEPPTAWTRPPLPVRWLPATLAVGAVATAVVGRVPTASVGAALFVVAIAAALIISGSVTSRSARWCLLLAGCFAAVLAVRTDPRLVAFNLLAATLLLTVAVIGPRRVLDWRPIEFLSDALSIAVHPFVMLGDWIPPAGHRRVKAAAGPSGRRDLLVGIVQGLVIAAPLLVVIAALLGSADAVFADFLGRGNIDASGAWYGVLRFSLGAAVTLVLISRTTRRRSEMPTIGIALGRTPTLVVLTALNATFALFVAAQLYALTSAGEQILADAGLTYRTYARQGFFQLLWVSGLTLVVLLSLRSAAERWYRDDRWFRWSSLATIVLTFGVVVVAFGRLQLYIADDGLTPLRFYSSVFSIWVAMGFVIVAVRLVGWRPSDAWTLPALVASGLLVLIGLNLVNPEARIAHNLIGRDTAGALLHMEKLSADGQFVMAQGLDGSDPAWAADARVQLCDALPVDDGWLAWNLGRSRARSALLELC